MTRVAIVSGVRTPIAKKDKSYRDVHPVDLLAASFNGAIAAAGIDPADVDMGLAGATGQVGGQAQNIGRNAWLSSGLPMSGAHLDPRRAVPLEPAGHPPRRRLDRGRGRVGRHHRRRGVADPGAHRHRGNGG